FVKEVCVGLRIPCAAKGATLFRRRDLDRGIEGDRTYYLAHEEDVRGRPIDLDNNDPPPDLVIEVETTHPAKEAIEIWGLLGVPEVWVHGTQRGTLAFLHLNPGGHYVGSPTSRSFPFLTARDVLSWIEQIGDEPDSVWQGRLREWVRDELARRLGERR